MTHDVRHSEFASLVDPGAPVRQIGSGFIFTEGPLWHPTEHYLLFSDMPGDVRRRWDEAGGVREVMRPANKCNGMTYDAELNLVICEHATSSLVRLTPDGRREVLASHFEGKELNSPNDVCVRSDGTIYFTDPWFGRMPHYGVERPRELGWQGVFRVSPDGALHLVVDKRQFDQPNGLCFSPDESKLYVNDTTRALIRVYDVAPDGSLSHGRLFAQGIQSSREAGLPDGMKCDAKGNIWVTAPGGIRVYSPRGAQLGTVRIPEMPANLHWGGSEWRTLFVCATTSVYAVETKVGPHVEPFMRRAGDERRRALRGSRTRVASSGPRTDASAPRATPRLGAPGAFRPDHGREPVRRRDASQRFHSRSLAYRAHHPGHAERRHGRGRRLRRQRLAPARPRAERGREHPPPRRALPGARGDGGARPLPGRARLAGPHAERAAVRGPRRRQRPGARDHGDRSAGRGPGAEARRSRGHEDAHERVGGVARWRRCSRRVAATPSSIPGPGPTCRSSTPPAPAPTRATYMVVPEDACSTMNAEWHAMSIGYALQNVAIVTRTDDVIAALGH